MSENKTRMSSAGVDEYLNKVQEKQQESCYFIYTLMHKITGEKPAMWGDSIVGFGQYHYKYESGREGDWFLTGFSARKQNITIYIMSGFDPFNDLLSQLGKHKLGRSCLYINNINQIDKSILEQIIRQSVDYMNLKYK